MVEPITIPFHIVVGLFIALGIVTFFSVWGYYGRKEAVKKLAKSLKTDTEAIADRLAIEGEKLAHKVELSMQDFVRNEVQTTYQDIAHDIALLTLAVKDVAKGSIIDAAKKDVVIMRLETEMRIMNKANLEMKKDAKEDAKEIVNLKEEAKEDTKTIERLENETTK